MAYNLPGAVIGLKGEVITTGEGFARPEYLVAPAGLQERLGRPDGANLVVVDLDAAAGYARGHVPGAVHLPDNYERNPATGWVNTLPPDKFAAVCQSLGIGDATPVVAYDNNLSLYAARFWWTLNYYGHTNVQVLDGGWRRWAAEGGPVSFDPPAAPAVAPAGAAFTPRIDPSLLVEFDEVKAGCPLEGAASAGSADTVIWDTRSAGEYSGAVNRGNKRAGHIAGAVHLDWLDLMDRESHRFKPAGEVRRILNAKGITPDKAVFAY